MDVTERTHREIVDLLTSVYKYKLILLPRGGFKTSICTIGYSIWRLARNPNLRVLIDSKTEDRSQGILSGIKEHCEFNDKFREVYGNWKNIPGWQESSITLPYRTTPRKEPSIDTGGVDAPKTGGHYDLIIADDLHDERNIDTEWMRNKVKLHYKTLFPLLEPEGEIIIVGTRWHYDDLYNYILTNERVTKWPFLAKETS